MLKEILANKKKEIADLKKKRIFFFKSRQAKHRKTFRKIFQKGKIALIAEIKRKSPSAGIIKKKLNPAKLAKIYEAAGAAAVSVLTDQKFFGAGACDLKKVREAVRLPVLKKDFIVDERQIYCSAEEGADCILLIAAVLSFKKIKKFLALAENLGMDCLIEVHNLAELKNVLKTRAKIIGINNRNLKTGAVNFETTLKLAPLIPASKILVSESGIKNAGQVRILKKLGVQGILVGESILKSKNIFQKIKELKKG